MPARNVRTPSAIWRVAAATALSSIMGGSTPDDDGVGPLSAAADVDGDGGEGGGEGEDDDGDGDDKSNSESDGA